MPWYTVRGVVTELRHYGLDGDLTPTIYVNDGSNQMSRAFWMLKAPAVPADLLAQEVRAAVSQIDPAQPLYSVMPLRTHVGSSLWTQKFLTSNFLLFSIIALVLAAIGLYSVIAYSVVLRQSEIGIRMAVGASARQIIGLVARSGLRLVAIGMVLGLPLAMLAAHALTNLLYGASAVDLVVYGSVAGTVVAAGLLATWIPARAASRLHPIETLGSD